MKKKFVLLLTVLAVIFVSNIIFAACGTCGSGTDDAAKKLIVLRGELRSAKENYEQEIQKADKECGEKVDAARKEFHKVRDGILDEKNKKTAELTRAYKDKIQPLLTEEKNLLQSLSASQANFVKSRKK